VNDGKKSKKIKCSIREFICPIGMPEFILDAEAFEGFVTVNFL